MAKTITEITIEEQLSDLENLLMTLDSWIECYGNQGIMLSKVEILKEELYLRRKELRAELKTATE